MSETHTVTTLCPRCLAEVTAKVIVGRTGVEHMGMYETAVDSVEIVGRECSCVWTDAETLTVEEDAIDESRVTGADD